MLPWLKKVQVRLFSYVKTELNSKKRLKRKGKKGERHRKIKIKSKGRIIWNITVRKEL